MAVTGVSHSYLLIELGPICNSIATSLLFKSSEDHNSCEDHKVRKEAKVKILEGLN